MGGKGGRKMDGNVIKGQTVSKPPYRFVADKLREKILAGAWYQDDSGKWLQKK